MKLEFLRKKSKQINKKYLRINIQNCNPIKFVLEIKYWKSLSKKIDFVKINSNTFLSKAHSI